MAGCSVFTLPSMISGKPVSSATSVTGNPASLSAFAVPPVETSVTSRCTRARANSISPVLSETEISARRTVRRVMGLLLLAKEPKEKRENHADDETGDNRKIDLHAWPVDRDVARQAAEPELPQPWPEDANGDQSRTNDDQRSTYVHQLRIR